MNDRSPLGPANVSWGTGSGWHHGAGSRSPIETVGVLGTGSGLWSRVVTWDSPQGHMRPSGALGFALGTLKIGWGPVGLAGALKSLVSALVTGRGPVGLLVSFGAGRIPLGVPALELRPNFIL